MSIINTSSIVPGITYIKNTSGDNITVIDVTQFTIESSIDKDYDVIFIDNKLGKREIVECLTYTHILEVSLQYKDKKDLIRFECTCSLYHLWVLWLVTNCKMRYWCWKEDSEEPVFGDGTCWATNEYPSGQQ